MVCTALRYTQTSLWISAQPLQGSGNEQPCASKGAHLFCLIRFCCVHPALALCAWEQLCSSELPLFWYRKRTKLLFWSCTTHDELKPTEHFARSFVVKQHPLLFATSLSTSFHKMRHQRNTTGRGSWQKEGILSENYCPPKTVFRYLKGFRENGSAHALNSPAPQLLAAGCSVSAATLEGNVTAIFNNRQ